MNKHEKGYRILWTPYTELYHYESKIRGYEDTPEKQERFSNEVKLFQHRWSQFLLGCDPYYNPNLTVDQEDFSIDPRKNAHITQFGRGQSPRSV